MTKIILASGSRIRAELLDNAGLQFEVIPAEVDEDAVKTGFADSPAVLACELAGHKANAVSQLYRKDLVIGADQVLSCDGRAFDKPKSMDEARANLQFFRGKTHTLHSAVALFRDGGQVWSGLSEAHLSMRLFSDEFLENYLDLVGDKALASVGAYQLEGPGVQLFERIDGDYFTVLGLPLLDLLAQLRLLGMVQA